MVDQVRFWIPLGEDQSPGEISFQDRMRLASQLELTLLGMGARLHTSTATNAPSLTSAPMVVETVILMTSAFTPMSVETTTVKTKNSQE